MSLTKFNTAPAPSGASGAPNANSSGGGIGILGGILIAGLIGAVIYLVVQANKDSQPAPQEEQPQNEAR